MNNFGTFQLELCEPCQAETTILISNLSAKPWLTLQRSDIETCPGNLPLKLRSQGKIPSCDPAQVLLQWGIQSPSQALLKAAWQCEEGMLRSRGWEQNKPSTLGQNSLLQQNWQRCSSRHCTSQIGQGMKPRELSLLVVSSHSLILPSQCSTTPSSGATEAVEANTEAGDRGGTQAAATFYWGQGEPCASKPWAIQQAHQEWPDVVATPSSTLV